MPAYLMAFFQVVDIDPVVRQYLCQFFSANTNFPRVIDGSAGPCQSDGLVQSLSTAKNLIFIGGKGFSGPQLVCAGKASNHAHSNPPEVYQDGSR